MKALMKDHPNATIIIPTKNRPLFIERLLEYYRYKKFENVILIADGSDEPFVKQVEEFVSQYSEDLHIDYVHKSNLGTIHEEDNIRELDHRILGALRRVDTPYTVLSGDDDFFFPDSIKKGINFLENNPDYELYHGKALYFMVKNNEAFGSIVDIGEYAQYSISDETVKERCISHLMINCASNWHSVFRTQSVVEGYEATNKKQLDLTFYEPFLSTIFVMRGKVFCDDSISLLRQGMVQKDFDNSMLDDFVLWLSSEDWIRQYSVFIDGLAEEYVKYNKEETESEVKVFFRKLYWSLISENLLAHCNTHKQAILHARKKRAHSSDITSSSQNPKKNLSCKKVIKLCLLFLMPIFSNLSDSFSTFFSKKIKSSGPILNSTAKLQQYIQYDELMNIFKLITSKKE